MICIIAYKIRKDDALERIKSWNAVLVIRDDTSFCYLISRDYRHVCKAVRFDNRGEIIATAGIDVLKITADQVKEPDSIPEMLELYLQTLEYVLRLKYTIDSFDVYDATQFEAR